MATAIDNVDDSELDLDFDLVDEADLDEDIVFLNIDAEEQDDIAQDKDDTADGAVETSTMQNEKDADADVLKKCDQLLDDMLDDLKKLQKARSVKEELEQKGTKTSYVDSAEDYKVEAAKALQSGPQSSPLELVLQLECHERLYKHFCKSDLQPNLLSFYLEEMKQDRWLLLDWMGSDHTPDDYMGRCMNPPEVPLRLNKIPTGREVLSDKGFDGTDRFYPNMNPVRTPLLLRARKVKQYLREEIFGEEGNRSLFRLCYTSEVAYSRVTNADSLKDTIRYHNISLLQHMHSWEHAMINLYKSLQKPNKLE